MLYKAVVDLAAVLGKCRNRSFFSFVSTQLKRGIFSVVVFVA